MIKDSQNKTHRLEDHVSSMMQGQDSITAAQSAFGDLTKLDQALEAYVHQLNFMLYKTNYVSTVNESSFQARPIDDTEVDAIRADVLALSGRSQEAKALLASVLLLDPKVRAYETWNSLSSGQATGLRAEVIWRSRTVITQLPGD